MSVEGLRPGIEAFFLAAESGRLFCVLSTPPNTVAARGSILFVPAFAEEANKSRRMCARTARRLACAGYTVLQMDLFGCGDSDGDAADARWEGWQANIAQAWQWLGARAGAGEEAWLWGLRLGASLVAATSPVLSRAPYGLLLWQPVTSGEAFITQFLRVQLASEMLANKESGSGGVKGLRERLSLGEAIEIAGYVLSPELVARIDALKLASLRPVCRRVVWMEMVADSARGLSVGGRRATEAWAEHDLQVDTLVTSGPQFWATAEITESEAFVAATIDGVTR